MKRLILIALFGLLMLFGTVYAEELTQAEEIEMLRSMVEEQNRKIFQLLQRLEALEAKQVHETARIEEKKEEKPIWTERVRLKGDFRYRYEYIDDGRKDEDRGRNRIRARVGLEAKVTDTMDVGFQVATGEPKDLNAEGTSKGGDPVSNNQTLTDAFTLKDIWLSEAYFDWHPEHLVTGFRLIGGKMHRPFHTVGGSELIWDSDINPEGGVIEYARPVGPLEAFGSLYGFWVVERGDAADAGMFGAQGGLRHNVAALGDNAYLLGGAGYYDFTHVGGEETFFFSNGNPSSFGNTLNPDGTFAENFGELELFGEAGFQVRTIPLQVFANYVTNTEADGENDGWLVGLALGKAREPGSWAFRYTYRVLEKDAVVGAFTDSDFGGGGTNAKGHEFNLIYMIARNWEVAATYFHNETGIASGEDEESFDRVQLDMLFKF